MKRVTLRIPKQNLEDVEDLVDEGTFPNRSEAIREAVRDLTRKHGSRPRAVADGSGELNPDLDEMDTDDVEAFLEDYDVSLLFITDNGAIHEIRHEEGRLTFLKGGSYGYDEETSRETLEKVVTNDGAAKFVPFEKVREDRDRLVDGEYDTVSDWEDDTFEVAV